MVVSFAGGENTAVVLRNSGNCAKGIVPYVSLPYNDERSEAEARGGLTDRAGAVSLTGFCPAVRRCHGLAYTNHHPSKIYDYRRDSILTTIPLVPVVVRRKNAFVGNHRPCLPYFTQR